MNSSLLFTLLLASTGSCLINVGPMSLYTLASSEARSNSWIIPELGLTAVLMCALLLSDLLVCHATGHPRYAC